MTNPLLSPTGCSLGREQRLAEEAEMVTPDWEWRQNIIQKKTGFMAKCESSESAQHANDSIMVLFVYSKISNHQNLSCHIIMFEMLRTDAIKTFAQGKRNDYHYLHICPEQADNSDPSSHHLMHVAFTL